MISNEEGANRAIDKNIGIGWLILLAVVVFLISAVIIVLPDVMPYFLHQGGSFTGTSTQSTPQNIQTVVPPSASSLFETYARLVTLQVTLLSILGIFFGYLIRKNVSDLEDGLYRYTDRTLDVFNKKQLELDKAVKNAEELKSEFERMMNENKEMLERLSDSLRQQDFSRQVTSSAVDEEAAELDSQLEDIE